MGSWDIPSWDIGRWDLGDTLDDVSTIADLEVGLARVVLDSLVGADLRPAGGAPQLYTGPPPSNCCPAIGEPADVVVWWEKYAGSADRPPATAPFGHCAMPALATIHIRALVCWPTPSEPAPPIAQFQDTARWIAEAAWVGHEALRTLVCETQSAVRLRRWGVRDWWIIGSTPLRPLGGCAGVQWDLVVQPAGNWPDGDVLPLPA